MCAWLLFFYVFYFNPAIELMYHETSWGMVCRTIAFCQLFKGCWNVCPILKGRQFLQVTNFIINSIPAQIRSCTILITVTFSFNSFLQEKKLYWKQQWYRTLFSFFSCMLLCPLAFAQAVISLAGIIAWNVMFRLNWLLKIILQINIQLIFLSKLFWQLKM